MSDKFLIDECLSVELVRTARSRNFPAEHVTRLGLSGQPDHIIAAYAVAWDYTLVTNNAKDFTPIYSKHSLHCGLVLIIPQVRRELQVLLFDKAIDAFKRQGELINKTLTVQRDGTFEVTGKWTY